MEYVLQKQSYHHLYNEICKRESSTLPKIFICTTWYNRTFIYYQQEKWMNDCSRNMPHIPEWKIKLGILVEAKSEIVKYMMHIFGNGQNH